MSFSFSLHGATADKDYLLNENFFFRVFHFIGLELGNSVLQTEMKHY
jgi:hypothetical protein